MNKNIISHHGIHINFQFLDIQQQMKGQNYRFDDLQKVWVQLTNTKGANAYVFKQQLNLISRIIIWDDQNQTDFFGYKFILQSSICQLKVFEVLIEIFSKSKDKDVINAIIGFFTTMLTNLARQPSINYLLSHSSIISLQLTKFGNMGNEIADYYINFLKVLSRKITLNNLNLFYNKRYPNFPILNQATRFFNHPQNLVRTTSRNIILTIAKLKSQAIHKYMSGFPFVSYFIHECNFIREYWLIIDNILHTEEENRYELDNIDTLIQDHEEIIIFLDDLMGLNQRGVPEKFIDAFINESLSPLVIALDSEHKQGFSIKITLYLLAILFKTFNHTFILDTLALIFFGKYYPKDLLICLFQPIDRLLSYDKKWKFKGFWDSHDDKIVQYSSETYHFDGKKKIINEPTLIENISKRIDTFSVFGVTNNFYQRQIEKIENTFNIPIISPADKITRKSGSTVIKEMIDQITSQKGVNLNDYEMNPICDTIFSYITSKDDSLVILTLNILSILFQNSSISEKIKRHCKMSLQSEINDFQSVMRIEKLIIQCVKIFQVDPPCYRICTYMEAQELVKRIIVFYKKSSLPISKDIVISLKHSLKIALDRINPYLYGGKQWEKTLQIYHEVQKNYTKRRSKTLKTFGLIPNDQSNESEVMFTNMVYQEYPKDFCQQITRDFWIFLLIKDLFLYVNQEYSIYKIQLPKNENTGYKYQMGKMYKAVDQQKIEAQFRTSVMQNYSFCELILMSGYFAILRNNRIQVRANYEQLIVMSDKSDPRKILLNLQEGNVWIGLKEAKVALQLKKHFQESKSVMLRYRLTQKIKENEILSALL